MSTTDPAKAGISAYFSVAIHRALSKEVLARQRHERRMRVFMPMHNPDTSLHYERMKARALKALQFLPPYERQLLEDHLIQGVTLERLGREQRIDKRTVRKRIKKAIEILRERSGILTPSSNKRTTPFSTIPTTARGRRG